MPQAIVLYGRPEAVSPLYQVTFLDFWQVSGIGSGAAVRSGQLEFRSPGVSSRGTFIISGEHDQRRNELQNLRMKWTRRGGSMDPPIPVLSFLEQHFEASTGIPARRIRKTRFEVPGGAFVHDLEAKERLSLRALLAFTGTARFRTSLECDATPFSWAAELHEWQGQKPRWYFRFEGLPRGWRPAIDRSIEEHVLARAVSS